MYELFVESHFSAAHRLDRYPGNCARWHGHNWHVTAFFEAANLNELGMAVDFRNIKDTLRNTLAAFDHRDLNEVPELVVLNPTCEVIAQYIYRELAKKFGGPDVRVSRVKVSETPGAGAIYSE